ncbi:MAG: YncE family protein, partial [Bacteroidetes bacterium]|nr:YncE family protein [Bacteroidota bacterium]
MKKLSLILVLNLLVTISFSQHFQLIKKTVIGGEGGWDYLSADEQNKRLYVSHSTKAEVL